MHVSLVANIVVVGGAGARSGLSATHTPTSSLAVHATGVAGGGIALGENR